MGDYSLQEPYSKVMVRMGYAHDRIQIRTTDELPSHRKEVPDDRKRMESSKAPLSSHVDFEGSGAISRCKNESSCLSCTPPEATSCSRWQLEQAAGSGRSPLTVSRKKYALSYRQLYDVSVEWDECFFVTRSQVAQEAAKEAGKRSGNYHFFTTTTVGRGSVQADAVLERDKRLKWNQGFPETLKERKTASIIFENSTVQKAKEGIGKQAAAVGRAKQKLGTVVKDKKSSSNLLGDERNHLYSVNCEFRNDEYSSIEVVLKTSPLKLAADTKIDLTTVTDGRIVKVSRSFCPQEVVENNCVETEPCLGNILDSGSRAQPISTLRVLVAFARAIGHFSSKIDKTRRKTEIQ